MAKKSAKVKKAIPAAWSLVYILLPTGQVVIATEGVSAGVFKDRTTAARYLIQVADDIRLTPPVPPPLS